MKKLLSTKEEIINGENFRYEPEIIRDVRVIKDKQCELRSLSPSRLQRISNGGGLK